MTTFCWLPPDKLRTNCFDDGVFVLNCLTNSSLTFTISPSLISPPLIYLSKFVITVLSAIVISTIQPKRLRSSER